LEAGRPFSRLQLLQAWLREFETLYEQFLSGGFPAILAEWQKYCITLGQPVKVLQGSQEISGTAVAVAADGSLLLQTTAGTLVQVISGEITPASEPDL
jgi:BirA family biotin operon repressor/biotin-[acetyl-CoA-carboxylase] ligase